MSSVENIDNLNAACVSPENVNKKCGICRKEEARYACPRCNRPYCSLRCYQDEAHADCSEAFYRECVVEELTARSESGDPESRRRIQEALLNVYQQNNEEDLIEELDSDDDPDEEDLADRLKGIDLNDAEAVWAQLSKTEQSEFKKLIQSGQVEDLLPEWDPWWVSKPVEEVESESTASGAPEIIEDVPAFKDLCKSKPASCLPFNVANTVAGYVYCCRQFQGDIHSEPLQAVGVICSIAGSLRGKENFDTFSHAIAAASAEAVAKDEVSGEVLSLLKRDVEAVMKNPLFLQAALSDVLVLLHAALKLSKKPKTQKKGAFTQQFGSETSANLIPNSDLKALIKKVEFYLSWAKEFS